ncbi:unnamed protein product, partial [Staurois parvus]
MTVIGMYRRGVWRYDSDRYVKERSVGDDGIGMYRRGVWRYDSDRYVPERSAGGMTVIGMYRRGVRGGDSATEFSG